MEPTETTSSPARPFWTGFRWGAAASGLYALLASLGLSFVAVMWDAGANATWAEALPTLAIFTIPVLIGGIVFGGIGGAITMLIVYWLLGRMQGITRGPSWLAALGVCLVLMLVLAIPALMLLYADGNFWRGLEESMIVAIPFFFLPGIFYIVAMILATRRNFARWYPERDRPA